MLKWPARSAKFDPKLAAKLASHLEKLPHREANPLPR
jgi:hypothetical protein